MTTATQGELVRRAGENSDVCTRFRPRRTSELIGASTIRTRLSKAIQAGGSRPKAYLLAGLPGCGKTTSARIAAMGLNCEKGDTPEPCLECPSCKAALAGNAMHIIELNVARLNTKDDADAIVMSMSNCALTGRNKVYILDEAHMLTKQAQNLLLKNLEEPPPRTYVFLCTTEPKKLLPTIRQRCETWTFQNPTAEDISEILNAVYGSELDAGVEMPEVTGEQAEHFKASVNGRSFREIIKALDAWLRTGDRNVVFIEDDDPIATSIGHIVCGYFDYATNEDWKKKTVPQRMQAIATMLWRQKQDDPTLVLGRSIEGYRLNLLAFFTNKILRNAAEDKCKFSIDAQDNMLMRCTYFKDPMDDERDSLAKFLVACRMCIGDMAEAAGV